MPRSKITQGIRRRVAESLGAQPDGQPHPIECRYCGHPGTITLWAPGTYPRARAAAIVGHRVEATLDYDHVVALSRGGENTAENIVMACWHCNASKSNRTLAEWVEVLQNGSKLPRRHIILERLGVS